MDSVNADLKCQPKIYQGFLKSFEQLLQHTKLPFLIFPSYNQCHYQGKRCGYALFSSSESAEEARTALNGQEVN